MTLSLRSAVRAQTVLAAVCSSACVLSYQVGNNPAATDGAGTSSGESADPPQCGDGLVDEAEACDDGNDDPDDGCDAQCRLTPVVEWTRSDLVSGVIIMPGALAVDPTGRLVVVGRQSNDTNLEEPLVLVLDAEGDVVWRHTIPGVEELYGALFDVAVDGGGRIFVGGYEVVDGTYTSIVRCYSPDAEELWRFEAPGLKPDAHIRALALDQDALYSVGNETQPDDTIAFVVRRHDPVSGAVAWATLLDDGVDMQAHDIVVSGSTIVVAGHQSVEHVQRPHPLVVALDASGDVVSQTFDPQTLGTWYGVAPIGGAGDLLLAGALRREGDDDTVRVLRRIHAAGDEVFSIVGDGEAGEFLGVAASPAERIVAVGTSRTGGLETTKTYVHRLDGGASASTVWTLEFRDIPGAMYEEATAVAFGPGYVVSAGQWISERGLSNLWVRRFADR